MVRVRVPVLVACLAPAACGLDHRLIALSADATGAASDGVDSDAGGVPPADGDSGGEPPSPPEPVCGTESATALARCVEPSALVGDVGFIADIRVPGTTHWLAVQEMCADRLTMLGFDVELHEYATGINVIGRRYGTTNPEQVVLLGAHYDHVPGCLGADDNATGVAGVLEAARVLSLVEHERTIAVACWDEEERGLLGSVAWVVQGRWPEENVLAYYNYDMIGFASREPDTQAIPAGLDVAFPEQYQQVEANDFRGDFILVIPDEFAEVQAGAYVVHADMLGLPTVLIPLSAEQKNSAAFGDFRRSDHAPFWAVDTPAIFFTDSANLRNPAYHCAGGEDSIDSLDFEFSRRVVAATVGSAAETLGVPRG